MSEQDIQIEQLARIQQNHYIILCLYPEGIDTLIQDTLTSIGVDKKQIEIICLMEGNQGTVIDFPRIQQQNRENQLGTVVFAHFQVFPTDTRTLNPKALAAKTTLAANTQLAAELEIKVIGLVNTDAKDTTVIERQLVGWGCARVISKPMNQLHCHITKAILE